MSVSMCVYMSMYACVCVFWEFSGGEGQSMVVL